MNFPFVLLIQRRMMFGAVVALVGLAWVQEEPELVLGCTAAYPSELHIHELDLSLENVIVGYTC